MTKGGCLLGLLSCEGCPSRLPMDQRGFAEDWTDPLTVLDRRRNPTTALRGMIAGGHAFLLCGGPSANEQPLEQLSRRGVWSMAVNNMAGHVRVRPQAFVCADPPSKFSHSIWLDPGIMKFVPTPKMSGRRSKLRRKMPDGSFTDLSMEVPDCPNVWAFNRVSWLTPNDNFFRSTGACWGNHQVGVESTGQPKTVCTMLLALRLLYYLGARTIYLVGVDFRMESGYGYSFGQSRTNDAVESNNAQYWAVNAWLCELQNNGTFARFGLSVYNTFQRSGLRAFPYLPFEQAVEQAVGIVEAQPALEQWYDK
jgi:hypothetical protein